MYVARNHICICDLHISLKIQMSKFKNVHIKKNLENDHGRTRLYSCIAHLILLSRRTKCPPSSKVG
jgi:hypothetical protein